MDYDKSPFWEFIRVFLLAGPLLLIGGFAQIGEGWDTGLAGLITGAFIALLWALVYSVLRWRKFRGRKAEGG